MWSIGNNPLHNISGFVVRNDGKTRPGQSHNMMSSVNRMVYLVGEKVNTNRQEGWGGRKRYLKMLCFARCQRHRDLLFTAQHVDG